MSKLFTVAQLCIYLLAFCSFSVSADWQLDKAHSTLSFIATKDAHIADNHYFTELDATIDNDGQVKLEINMASVETNIAKRDQRLKDILFKVADYPHAKVSLNVRRGYLKSKPAGTQKVVNVSGNLSMLGANHLVSARLLITHRNDQQVSVTTMQPILVDAVSYNMMAGIDTLTKLAGLKTISKKIPVSFNLVFNKK